MGFLRSILHGLTRGSRDRDRQEAVDQPTVDPEEDELSDEPEEIVLEITDVLDLHSFPPREVEDVVRDYLDAAVEEGLRSLRIIHGRGTGTQRRMVRALLERDPRVLDYRDAPPEGGGWGATLVELAADDGGAGRSN